MKKFFAALALLVCVWALPQAAWAADVYYGDKLICQSEHRFDSMDGASVPVRQLFEALGYVVKYNAEYNSVSLYHPQLGSIGLRPGDRNMRLICFEDPLPVAPYFVDDVLYAPLCLLNNEYCGYKAEWQPENQRWQISDKQQQFVYPFANLSREQLSGVTFHFGKGCYTIYTAELNGEEIDKLLVMLKSLAYREPAFIGDAIEVSGGNPLDFTLQYADGKTLGFGENGYFFYFFRDNEETKGYLPADFSQQQVLRDFCELLKDKYLALQNA